MNKVTYQSHMNVASLRYSLLSLSFSRVRFELNVHCPLQWPVSKLYLRSTRPAYALRQSTETKINNNAHLKCCGLLCISSRTIRTTQTSNNAFALISTTKYDMQSIFQGFWRSAATYLSLSPCVCLAAAICVHSRSQQARPSACDCFLGIGSEEWVQSPVTWGHSWGALDGVAVLCTARRTCHVVHRQSMLWKVIWHFSTFFHSKIHLDFKSLMRITWTQHHSSQKYESNKW